METTPILIYSLEQKLARIQQGSASGKVVIGFDFFTNRITKKEKGGDVATLAEALGTMGITSTCAGNMKLPQQREVLLASEVVALVNWANLSHSEDILEGVLEDIIKPSGRRDFVFFFDLGDPSTKTPYEIDDILDLISSFSFYGQVTLGLNKMEALAIWSTLTGVSQAGPVEEAGKFIHYAMDIDRLMIHLPDRTVVFQKRDTIELRGRVVSRPRIQTHCGDHLNAGYILGLIHHLSLEESMILGMAASGSYIEEGRSTTLAEIQRYLSVWRSELESLTTTPQAA